MYEAAAPATWGAAIDVPLMVLYPPPIQVERMQTPGAARSTPAPAKSARRVVEFQGVARNDSLVAPGATPRNAQFALRAATATRRWSHRLYSDAPFRTDYTLPTDGNFCGSANRTTEIGSPAIGTSGRSRARTPGQRECFGLTSVEGTRESEPSAPVCLTWTDATT